MDAGPTQRQIRPEKTFSGLFFAVLFLLAPAHGQPPSELLEELCRGRDLSDAHSVDSAAAPLRAIVAAEYNDWYFYRRVDTGASRKLLEQTKAYSPRINAALVIDRATWGVTMHGKAGVASFERSAYAEKYDYSVDAPFNAVSGEGWLQTGPLHLSGMLGYDKGLPVAYAIDGKKSAVERLQTLPADPRFMHALTVVFSLTPGHAGLYEKKQPFLSAVGRIESNTNHTAIELPLSTADQEYGAFSTFCMGQDSCGITVGHLTTSSDAGPAGNTALPVTIAGDGWRCGIAAATASIPVSPWLSFTWHSREMQLRGYDGNAPDPYSYLDRNRFIHSCFETGFNLPWKLENTVFFESATFYSKRYGRFDPYPFSAFTIFDPVKYRIDSAGFRYRSAGTSIGRAISVFRRDSAVTRCTVAWLELEGSLATREYDFSFVIPRLINPRFFSLAGEKRLLITPELHYSFRRFGLTCTGMLRQIIPINLAKSGGRNRGAPSYRRTVRGGATAGCSVEYGF
jgi:hypothetical protein